MRKASAMIIPKHLPRLLAWGLFLLLTVFCAVTVLSAAETAEPRILNVRDYGAVGDGVTNDTAAINAAAADLRDGETLYIPAGTYLLREYGEMDIILIQDRRNIHIRMEDGAILQLDTVEDHAISDENHHFILHLVRCENSTVTGGAIYGDRLRYTGSMHVEQGYGIRMIDCKDLTLRGVEIAYLRGDGIMMFTGIKNPDGTREKCENITVDNCHVHDCLRNGITLSSVDGCVISNTVIHGIRGTAPEAAVDIEAEFSGTVNKNVLIEGCRFYDNGKLSVAVTGPAESISVSSTVLEQQFALGDQGGGLTLSDCDAGLVTLSGQNAVIENCRIYQLRLYGCHVTCTDTVFDGLPASSAEGKDKLIPFRVLVTKSDGTTVGHFESCTFRGRRLCALGGGIVFCHTPPAEMTFTDCGFKSCGLIPFLGQLDTTEREDCFFGLGWPLWLCITAAAALVTLLILRRRRRVWVSKPAT